MMAEHKSSTTAVLERPATPPWPVGQPADDRLLTILGVGITDVTRDRALELITEMIADPDGPSRQIFFANAHTLNLAAADPSYRDVLRLGDHVFGDGTGVRWASTLQGARVRDNLVGTDLVPALFEQTAGCGYRYFLLGSDEQTIRFAAERAEEMFPGWTQAGYHHGYLNSPELNAQTIRQINESRSHLLLVGMGNPLQEHWIHDYHNQLDVPVCMGIGGLFDYWAENVSRSPEWLRKLGHEWLWRLWQQPSHKARRYLLGNPLFLLRIFRESLARLLGREIY